MLRFNFFISFLYFFPIFFTVLHSAETDLGNYYESNEIELQESNKVGNIIVSEKVDISFDIICESFPASGYQNILHIGGPGLYPRLPSLYFYGSQTLHIAITDSANINRYWNINYNFQTNTNYNIRVYFDLQSTKVWINNELKLDVNDLNLNRDQYIGKYQPLYFGEGPSLYPSANALLKNVVIIMNACDSKAFYSNSIQAKDGNKVGCITFDNPTSVKFDITCKSFPASGFQNILHVGGPGHYPRLPSIYFYGSQSLHPAISDNGNINYYWNINYKFQTNIKYSMKYCFSEEKTETSVNNQLLLDANIKVSRSNYIGNSYPIYVGEGPNIYPPADCLLEYVTINNKDESCRSCSQPNHKLLLNSITLSAGNKVGCFTFDAVINLSFDVQCSSFPVNSFINLVHVNGNAHYPRLPSIYFYGSQSLQPAISDNSNINRYWNINYNFQTNTKYNLKFYFDLQSTKVWINNELKLDVNGLNLNRDQYIGNTYPVFLSEGPNLYPSGNCVVENFILESNPTLFEENYILNGDYYKFLNYNNSNYLLFGAIIMMVSIIVGIYVMKYCKNKDELIEFEDEI